MFLASPEEYDQESPQDIIKDANHNSRNAITPAFISVAILKKNFADLTPEKIQQHLEIIEQSLRIELDIIENRNKQVEAGTVLIFKKRQDIYDNSNC